MAYFELVGFGMMKKILYISGTRADFGLMLSTLKLMEADPDLDISVCVTGIHLSEKYGLTVNEIVESGIRICGRIPVDIEETSGASMARAIGTELVGMVSLFENENPDAVLLLGDRGEQLAGALAAIHLNIPIIHLHGGERSGTVDEPVRHAISKLAHFHFVATDESRTRLIRMGEQGDRVFVTGAPGLDSLLEVEAPSREELCQEFGLDPKKQIALVLFHPVLQDEEDMATQTSHLLDAVLESNLQPLVLMPNADAGGNSIRDVLENYRERPGVCLKIHLSRKDFIAWMTRADIMVGNSSSGIIEAATFRLPVVNVGNRQKDRERNRNVVDVAPTKNEIIAGIQKALSLPLKDLTNLYGDGQSGKRIVDLIKGLKADKDILNKSNSY